jgi:hypothetical protein
MRKGLGGSRIVAIVTLLPWRLLRVDDLLRVDEYCCCWRLILMRDAVTPPMSAWEGISETPPTMTPPL